MTRVRVVLDVVQPREARHPPQDGRRRPRDAHEQVGHGQPDRDEDAGEDVEQQDADERGDREPELRGAEARRAPAGP